MAQNSGVSTSTLAFLLLWGISLPLASSEGFLGNSHPGFTTASLESQSEELQAAFGAVLGCTSGAAAGGHPDGTWAIHEALLPVWRALPKNSHGRVEWALVRYMAHRHFMQRFGILVRGLEPSMRVNASHVGEAEILSRQAPELAKQMLNGPQAQHGFSLEDTAAMVAALEQLVFDSESALLEKVYRSRQINTHRSLSRTELQAVLMDFMVYWFVGDDQESAAALLQNPQMLSESIPHWKAIVAMVEGSVRAREFSQQRMPRAGAGRTVLGGHNTFEDALEVAGAIGKNFAHFWEAQCQDIKDSLLALDTAGTGRVRLSDFYGSNKQGEWRFGESEVYLRELGALDETSSWHGKQVIISNYMQAASNCIASRPHHLVCCINECEDIMGQVEAAVGGPMAAAPFLLQVVGNITNGDDEPARVDDAMQSQLLRIAREHSGKVPLHGRLFAQWLHYAFPRECPFPHRAGIAATLTPGQFGGSYEVRMEEVEQHIADEVVRKDLELAGGNASALEWMSQWSEDEELLVDYSQQFRASWGGSHLLAVGGAAAALVGALWASSAKGDQFSAGTLHSV